MLLDAAELPVDAMALQVAVDLQDVAALTPALGGVFVVRAAVDSF